MRSLRDLTQHLTTRADDSHAAPVQALLAESLPFQASTTCMSRPGKVLRVDRIKPHTPPLVQAPVNFFEFNLATVLPRRCTYRVSFATNGVDSAHSKCTPFTARTTRVSNPVCSPSFRASVLGVVQRLAFATGVPLDIYAFHCYTENSSLPSDPQAREFSMQFPG